MCLHNTQGNSSSLNTLQSNVTKCVLKDAVRLPGMAFCIVDIWNSFDWRPQNKQ